MTTTVRGVAEVPAPAVIAGMAVRYRAHGWFKGKDVKV
jgi:hypothetical protein